MCGTQIKETRDCSQQILAIRTCSREYIKRFNFGNRHIWAYFCSIYLGFLIRLGEGCIDRPQNTVTSSSLLSWSHHFMTRLWEGDGVIVTFNTTEQNRQL
jgi:hypothetical protein